MSSQISKLPASGLFAGASPVMSIGSALLVMAFVLFTVIQPEYAATVYGAAKDFIATNLAWYYIGLMSFFLFLAVWLSFSRYGKIRLGQDHERPEFSNFSWFSMLFGAGIGIGILFWSIAEPIYHFQGTPLIGEAQKMMRQMRDHFGIGLAFKQITHRLQFGAQLFVIFNDAVMHQSNARRLLA